MSLINRLSITLWSTLSNLVNTLSGLEKAVISIRVMFGKKVLFHLKKIKSSMPAMNVQISVNNRPYNAMVPRR
jgi:hypothetical protein